MGTRGDCYSHETLTRVYGVRGGGQKLGVRIQFSQVSMESRGHSCKRRSFRAKSKKQVPRSGSESFFKASKGRRITNRQQPVRPYLPWAIVSSPRRLIALPTLKSQRSTLPPIPYPDQRNHGTARAAIHSLPKLLFRARSLSLRPRCLSIPPRSRSKQPPDPLPLHCVPVCSGLRWKQRRSQAPRVPSTINIRRSTQHSPHLNARAPNSPR